MLVSEKITRHIKKLPNSLQSEVLDFVEFLLAKVERDQDDVEWSQFSLTTAMKGLEDEALPSYTLADLKVVFA